MICSQPDRKMTVSIYCEEFICSEKIYYMWAVKYRMMNNTAEKSETEAIKLKGFYCHDVDLFCIYTELMFSILYP